MKKEPTYRAGKRCSIYIKKMIGRGFWKPNDRLPQISRIAKVLDVSVPTIRKALSRFEKEGIIQNWGHLGYRLNSPRSNELRKKSKYSFWIRQLRLNLRSYDVLSKGGFEIQNWIVKFCQKTNVIFGLDIISGNRIRSSLEEISSILVNPIRLEKVLEIKDSNQFIQSKRRFDRQRLLLPLATLVNRNKKLLGIDA
jgi:DNA-binding GntR family transcriptional regulator